MGHKRILTEVDLRIVIDGNIDLLLSLGWAAIVLWGVVVGNRLHGFLDELVALIFKALAIAQLASVDAAAEVVVLRRWRRRPITFAGDDIIDSQLLADFLDAEMQGVRFELLLGQLAGERSLQAHETSSLVLKDVAPSIALAALHARAIARAISCSHQLVSQ